MSEVSRGGSGGGAFAKVVQKTLARTRTKVLQRVGKAEKTTDEVYKDNITAFQRQQATAHRLQKEMKHYLGCVKAMAVAAKGLYVVLKETYEEEWYDPQSFNTSLHSLELLHASYEAELAERVCTDLNEYVEQFPIYKEKMNKRNRKRLDYDNAKHAYETLYAAKKPDQVKITKAHDSLLDSKSLFEEINNELHRELPKFHEYRVELLASNLMRLCNAESTFHTNVGKVNDDMMNLLQTLSTSHAEEMERLNSTPPAKDSSMVPGASGEGLDLSSLSPNAPSPNKPNGHGADRPTNTPKTPQQKVNPTEESESRSRAPPPARPTTAPLSPTSTNGNPFVTSDDGDGGSQHSVNSKASEDAPPVDSSTSGNPFEEEEEEEEEKDAETEEKTSEPPTTTADVTSEEVVVAEEPTVHALSSTTTPTSDCKPSTSSTSSASTVLYQVMATHPYVAEDEDELSFDAGVIVNVVEFDGEEEQDDGWLMGINVNTLAKGVFPANFTQKIARKT